MPRRYISLLLMWIAILIVPSIIVIIFYDFFGSQNYFGINDGLFKGIVATGPIAAYVFLVWFGYKHIYVSLFDKMQSNDIRNIMPSIFGEWILESNSLGSNEKRSGKCRIREQGETIVLSGNFINEGINTGTWQSKMVTWDLYSCLFYYELDLLNKTTKQQAHYKSMCMLSFTDSSPLEMSGYWRNLNDDSSGYIKLTKQ